MKVVALTPGGLKAGRLREVSSGHSTVREGPNHLTQGADLAMRKREGYQRKGKQLNLFEDSAVSYRPANESAGPTGRGKCRETAFLSLLSGNRALTAGMLDEVLSLSNLDQAVQRLDETAVIREYVRWCERTEAGGTPLRVSAGLNGSPASSYSISK